ncbi:hypothetical protein K1719_029866 [Acacia pycnantha]|nr:hypothetical protein K1719_029866 [Acacia pycnantha]
MNKPLNVSSLAYDITPPSPEEEDALERSRKRVQAGEREFTNEQLLVLEMRIGCMRTPSPMMNRWLRGVNGSLLKRRGEVGEEMEECIDHKLLGRKVNLEYLDRKIQHLWAKYGEVELIDVSSGFYVVNFSDVHDYKLALTGGPWLAYDHYLSVKPWKQDLIPMPKLFQKYRHGYE